MLKFAHDGFSVAHDVLLKVVEAGPNMTLRFTMKISPTLTFLNAYFAGQ